ncbi:ribosome small subunit-dependent GTPase A [Levilactobacillus yiduensis]|uniref:ribosome small subunit-dependent GTPase A n=1 Tax=Levilactobacillus yiduensis TaxID=2953880 RepID=UPI000EF2FEF9|nr:ribosome small subunit-dependent GTPase A [Levilactobacillus yiduensis]AYM01545.1 ribosome small subunit-dependent GTPase A [Levilactobacillus brevis]
MTIDLQEFGATTDRFAQAGTLPGQTLARVTAQHRELYQVITARGSQSAQVAGRLSHNLREATDFPAVGDWVAVTATQTPAMIQRVLPRQSVLIRGAVGKAGGQVIAANVDTIFICMSLNANFNARRIERYLTMAWDSGAVPVVVLTKADLCADVAAKLAELAPVTVGVDVLTCSAQTGEGVAALKAYVTGNQTVSFIGSSGVGKSTLINHLLGTAQLATKAIRADDDKGRHATTARELLRLPDGGVVIDTPGMRELQVQGGNLDQAFADVTALASHCKFRNCTHQTEPGCAVQAALAAGQLDAERLASYQKLQRELAYSDMNARERENAKIERAFGSKRAMKQTMDHVKRVKRR